MENEEQGQIIVKQRGILTTYTCTCGAGCVEADEAGYYCIEAPEYGLNGCGATKKRGDE